MFTGIIEEIGIIKHIEKTSAGMNLTVCAKKVLEGTHPGDSIAIDGCCQTVTKLSNESFTVNVSPETISVSNFSHLKQNQNVNLERALTPTSRMGGHIVQGHIDGTGEFLNAEKYSEFYNLFFKIPKNIERYIVKKGSIAINGISLTIADIENNILKCAIIPHTFENTTLKILTSGRIVNIETDILGRYVEKILLQKDNINECRISENFLKENGFI